MSAFEAEPVRSDDEAHRGQSHNRIPSTGRVGGEEPGGSFSDEDGGPEDVEISAAQKMLSAISGSLLTSLLVTPLDVVRVRLQSQPNPSPSPSAATSQPSSFSNLPRNLGVTACCREVFWVNNNTEFCVASNSPANTSLSSAECAVEETQRRNFTSTFDGLRKIARNEGISTLWRGLSPTLVMAVPANVIYFAGYDWLRYSRRSPIAHRVSDAYAPLIAGSAARVTAATVISPIEMFRTRLQASSAGHQPNSAKSTSLFSETLKGLHTMVQHQGYSSLWRGLTLTLWRDVPFSGIYWWGYEAIRNGLTDARQRSRGNLQETTPGLTSQSRARLQARTRENHMTTLADSFIAGATSGAVAALLTQPFDVGKTRRQVVKHCADIGAPSSTAVNVGARALRPEDLSMPRFLWRMFAEEGVAGLWRGWAARCLKVAPACAIMISSYEIGKQMARGVNKGQERVQRI